MGAIVGNSGTIRPGSNSTKGILSGASANLSGGTNSTLSMRAAGYSTAGTDFDRLSLGGAATLGGSSVLNLDLSSLSGAGTVSGIVQSSGITGTFSTVNFSNYTGDLGYGLVYNTTSVDLVVRNQTPSFSKGADRSHLEDAGAQTVAGWATSISPGPAVEAGQSVTFSVTNDDNGLFSAQPAVAANGTLTYTLAANANGSATVTVVAHDDGGTANGGVDSSAAQTFTITVTSVNDAPSFTKGADKTVAENAGAQSFAGWATGISSGPANESGQVVSFVVANDNNGLFSAQPAVAANGTLTFTPAADANGSATVTVVVHDDGGTANGGVDSSAAQTFTITVTSVNDAPSFTKGSNQTVLEDAGAQSIAGWATGISAGPADESGQTVSFTVTNDNNGLFSAQPAVAANGTLTFTAAANANGTATVTVVAHDDGGTSNGGVDSSVAQTFTITVTSVNDAPSFTKGADKTVAENAGAQSFAGWATSISAGPADESGQAVSFTVSNDDNSLFSAQPAIAANGTLTFTPAADANGTATVTVVAHDDGGTANGGVDSSVAQTFTITVTSVNDAPSFTKGADKTVLEDAGAQSFAGWATGISAGPADESGQAVSFTVSNDDNSLFSAQPAIAANGTLTFTPAADANGTATVTVVAHDDGGTANGGVDSSAAQTFTITVTAVNDAPSFVKGVNPNVLQNAGAQSVAGWATGITAGPADESAQSLGFRVINGNNALFSAQPSIASTGTLEYTPALNANGSATVYVRLGDNGGTANGGVDSSAIDSFVISVGVVNQAPSFTKGADKTVLEDAGAQSFAGWATGISVGPGSEAWQTPGFRVTNSNSALFNAQPSITGTGELSFEPAPNVNGTATVYVRLGDDGGTADGGVDSSAIDSFTITVTAVNDAPSFVKGTNRTVLEDAGAQSIVGWATSLSAGPADESGQSLGFRVSNGNTSLFSAQPSIATNGTLSYTPASNANGIATVYVRLGDNGGTANGGVDSSAIDSFTITVTSVNDAPSFVKGASQTVLEDAGAQSVAGWATGISAGPAGESGQSLGFRVSNGNTSLFSAQPSIATNGTLSYTPASNANGIATVYVRLGDNGGTANGGVDSSAIDSFTITVTSVNDAPSFVKGADKSHLQNAGAQSFAGWATGIGAGPSDESGQSVGFRVSNSNVGLFSAQPSIAANGTLSYTLAANVNGVATVYVRLGDNGGTANGGVDSSAVDSFTITVTAVNQAPSFTKGSNQTVLEDAGAQSVTGWVTGISAGPAGESGQSLGFRVSTGNASLFSAQPVIASNGTLSYTPASN
ncbi:MAG TPA: Ig-like domain-containing protein, partial [Fibrobacteria bacterium]|nr:Ig-like domain-containing protein [Fibrobacteria bacterium]